MKENKQIIRTRSFDFNLIEKIYSWTNTYIHGGYRPYPWKTETALNYLSNLFYNGETTQMNYYSIYAGVEILESDIPIFKKRVEESLKSYSEDVQIKWLEDIEVAIINKNKVHNLNEV